MKWVAPYRRYLALRLDEDFELALSEAPEPVADLIRICLLSDRDHVEQARDALIATLPGRDEGEEGMTVRLASLDPFVELCESFPSSEQDRRKEMLNMGIAAAKEAIELSSRLADDPCVAFYSSVLSTGYRNADFDEQALPPQLRALGIYRRLAETEPSFYRPEIASTLNNLAIIWSNLRQRTAECEASEEALAIYRELADRDSAYKYHLCAALNNYGTTLVALYDFSPAREVYAEALPICRELAAEEPDHFSPDLASILDNLGTVLREVREFDAARDALQEAISIYRKLAEAEPAAYLPDVATALVNLGNCLNDRRDLTAARDAFQEALTIQRDLIRQDPDHYRPDLANTLSNFAGTLDGLQELSAAKESYRESLAIYQELSVEERHIYGPDVGRVLNNLGTTLHRLRELNAAHDALERALHIRRDLNRVETGAHSVEVATTLNNLGSVLSERQRFQPAREAFEEALGIWRERAAAEPDAYQYEVAMTLMNLGSSLMELRELAPARAALRDSIRMRRDLYAKQHQVYGEDVAMALNNLGSVLRLLGERNAALKVHEEALEIRQALANSEPTVYLPQLAQTLSGLGTALNDVGRLAAAQGRHREAVEIYRTLAQEQPGVYRYDVAMSLNDLGVTLLDADQTEEARSAFSEALAILRPLASDQPAYQHTLATALNNYGTALRDHGDLTGARTAYKQAHSIYCSESNWVDATIPAANLGRVEKQDGNLTLAVAHFEDALASLRQGLAQVTSPNHHDSYKAWLEDATTGLIEIYARDPESEVKSSRLAGLFESLRRHDLLDEIEGEAAALLREIERGNGSLAKSLARRNAVFVWMQAVDEAVVFAVARPGRKLVVQTSPKSLMTLFQSATEQTGALAGSQELRRLIEAPRDFGGSAPDRMIRRLMGQAFELLPKELKQILSESQPNTIFVSGCRLTLDFPVELLLKPQPEGGSAFVGLHKTMVRMHSLRDLQEVLSRKTNIRTGKRIILADPDASVAGWDRLDYALKTGQYLASLLADADLPCQELYGPNATRTPALTGLLDSRLGLFIFDGHGEDGSIILAPGERIRTKDLEDGRWTHGPFIYMDCCSAGTSHGRGGGRFEGLPSACLWRGARAVVASFHPQLEEPSAVFTRNLFEGLLRGATLGDALLETRRIVDGKYGGNPIVWATFTLWGDPSVTLQKDLKKKLTASV